MSSVPKFQLNTGAIAPAIGNERYVAQAIKESGIPREEIFITTKLAWHHPGREEEAIQESLRDLETDYVDLYLIHWPQALDANGNLKLNNDYNFTQTWAALEKIYESGRAKAIGVSNFSIKNLDILLNAARIIPADNQVELHPYLVQDELVQYCQAKGIAVTAYAPTGYATVRADPVINELAKKYGVAPTQITLAWHVARGVHVVPGSKNLEHQKENLKLPTLAEEDVKRITALDKNLRLSNAPDEKGEVGGWTVEQLGW
ncbi:hypothetical protein PHLGIDRAFT_29900 [Phlebiopsis gigantea 11061_1 CR5-6]|uniref:NADP-dependent oxidoreductase domain-containing protein n=1 Tax=Phlebiopsis gigantea (strain 11061_1 CR5-6) TaxID=745531 RepID=A0A0C3PM68_PHLG1|nr:hypothetical protein PHLGIDRAFT_29900 [Phlebiopsis gigantea 11061_1 CR5-6]